MITPSARLTSETRRSPYADGAAGSYRGSCKSRASSRTTSTPALSAAPKAASSARAEEEPARRDPPRPTTSGRLRSPRLASALLRTLSTVGLGVLGACTLVLFLVPGDLLFDRALLLLEHLGPDGAGE